MYSEQTTQADYHTSEKLDAYLCEKSQIRSRLSDPETISDSPLDRTISDYMSLVDLLNDTISSLNNRLSPILSQEAECSERDLAKSPLQDGNSPRVVRITNINVTMSAAINRLQGIINRSEA